MTAMTARKLGTGDFAGGAKRFRSDQHRKHTGKGMRNRVWQAAGHAGALGVGGRLSVFGQVGAGVSHERRSRHSAAHRAGNPAGRIAGAALRNAASVRGSIAFGAAASLRRRIFHGKGIGR